MSIMLLTQPSGLRFAPSRAPLHLGSGFRPLAAVPRKRIGPQLSVSAHSESHEQALSLLPALVLGLGGRSAAIAAAKQPHPDHVPVLVTTGRITTASSRQSKAQQAAAVQASAPAPTAPASNSSVLLALAQVSANLKAVTGLTPEELVTKPQVQIAAAATLALMALFFVSRPRAPVPSITADLSTKGQGPASTEHSKSGSPEPRAVSPGPSAPASSGRRSPSAEPGVMAAAGAAAAMDVLAPLGMLVIAGAKVAAAEVAAVEAAARAAAEKAAAEQAAALARALSGATSAAISQVHIAASASAAERAAAAGMLVERLHAGDGAASAAARGGSPAPDPDPAGVKRTEWAADCVDHVIGPVDLTTNPEQPSYKRRSPSKSPEPEAVPTATLASKQQQAAVSGPTPLTLDPRYPPYRPRYPRISSLSVLFQRFVGAAPVASGVVGSLSTVARPWAVALVKVATGAHGAPVVPPARAASPAPAQASAAAAGAAAGEARPASPSPPEVTAGLAGAATAAASHAQHEPAGQVTAVKQGGDQWAEQFEALVVSQPVCPEAAFAEALVADVSAEVAASRATAHSHSHAAASSERSPSPEPPAPAAAAATAATAVPATAKRGGSRRSRAAGVSPEPQTESQVGTQGYTAQQLQEAQVAIQEVTSAVRSGSSNSSSSSQADSIAEAVVAKNVDRWAGMIAASPAQAAEAVMEVQAVAAAVVGEVEGMAGSRGVQGRGVSVEVAAATAGALKGPSRAGKGRGWYTILTVVPPDLPSFLDPIKSLLSLSRTLPTTRSKYDPLSGGIKGAAAGPSLLLPAWDPLSRLHTLASSSFDERRPGAPGSFVGRTGGASIRVKRPPPKYDAISQLVDFVASLPERVDSAEWAAAAAADPLRRLLADAAGRSQALRAATADGGPGATAATAGATAKTHRRSRWAKYDPLADLFHPETPLAAKWEAVAAEMLAVEAVSGPQAPRFSAVNVMKVRGGQAFGAALRDYELMAVRRDGASRLSHAHPAVCAWIRAAQSVALAHSAQGFKMGPVWTPLLSSPQHADALSAAKVALPTFLRELQRRHDALYRLLAHRDSEQALTLLATLAAWTQAEQLERVAVPRSATPAAAVGTAGAASASAVSTVGK